MLAHLRTSIVMLLLMTALTGLAYPLAVTGVAQLLMPSSANGSMTAHGSTLIGQAWTADKYFWGRPSAAGNGYDASASSGSNLGPTSQKLMDRIKADSERLHGAIPAQNLPADAVTASGSGLDPHISPEFAALQIIRVAKARGMEPDKIKAVVDAHVERPVAGIMGEPRVNVLLLNMALDGLNPAGNG